MKYIKTFIFAVLIFGCSQKGTNKFQPFDELNGMRITKQISGEEAQKVIDKLHGKSVTPVDNSIIFYKGENGEAILYVSFYSDTNDAVAGYNKMVELISDGNEVFGHFHAYEINSQPLSMCLGMGQAHYFFYKNHFLYWLSCDMPIAQATVVDLINKLKNE